MRRIVFNGRVFAQPVSGVQRYGIETLRAVDRLLGAHPALLDGTDWQLALPHDAHDVPLLDHFEFRVLPLLSGHAWEQIELAAFARGAYLVNPSYSGPLLKRDQLVTVHDAAVRTQPSSYSRAYRALNALTMSLLAPRAHTLMTVSRFSAAEITSHYGLRREIVVARPGCDHGVPTAAPGADAALLRHHGLASGGYLLAVGSPKPSKNFALLPRALACMRDAPRWPVVVAGSLDRRVHPSGEGDAGIRWLGPVDDATLAALYRHAAWFVFPSLYEGFGLPALEAMAQGCPVLASNAASIPEVCGDAALYFDPHDPRSLAARLDEVSTRDDAAELRRELVRRGRERAASFRWAANAELIVERLVAAGAVAGGQRAVATALASSP